MPTFQDGKTETSRSQGLITNLQIELEGVRFHYNSLREILTLPETYSARAYSPTLQIPPYPHTQPLQAPIRPWLSCNLSGHHQEVCWDYRDACAPHGLSVCIAISISRPSANPIMSKPFHWTITVICQLISTGKGRKTHSALSTSPDLVGVPFAAPEPWRNLCVPVFVMEITTHPYI